ncbi:hypothetical protein ACGFNQ_37270 [Streptomyces asoensis]|uniref:hypothetical protein n=1 Tax=Streptomyces asoensis TaxID=249586 RepID=UPI0037149305
MAGGAEGEPASLKDRTLLRLSPHTVLGGLRPAARTVGAGEAYLAVADGATWLETAVAERAGDPLPVKVVRVPGPFLAGRPSALARLLSGGAALPTQRRPPVRERGTHGAPTLGQNVETLAHLALLARYGADWYRTTALRPSSAARCARSTRETLNPGSWRRAPYGLPLALTLTQGGAGRRGVE